MKLSRRLILRAAYEVAREKGKFTQYDIHDRIEELLGRPLELGEKVRITRVLDDEFFVVETKRDRETYRIVRIFIF